MHDNRHKLNGKRARFRITGMGKSAILLVNFKVEEARARARQIAEETPGIILVYTQSKGMETLIDF